MKQLYLCGVPIEFRALVLHLYSLLSVNYCIYYLINLWLNEFIYHHICDNFWIDESHSYFLKNCFLNISSWLSSYLAQALKEK
jgi:hypothetical protein